MTLDRMGKQEEALAVCQEVAAAIKPPFNDQLLGTLMIVFKATGHVHEGTAAYEVGAD